GVITTQEILFKDFGASLYLELYFKEEGNDSQFSLFGMNGLFVLLIIVILAALAGILLWLIFFYRKRYDVLVQGDSSIVGKDKVRRKSAYAFTLADGYSGAVSYCIGEGGQWKMLSPDADGNYVIPRGEATDDIYLEKRP
ncbi:MAG: hypothetical protein FWG60_00775, partial [Methanomassiliicoccaceae archaeon]|nr:hypothetical protein [Methanomassiliicoccaceae archaeon]